MALEDEEEKEKESWYIMGRTTLFVPSRPTAWIIYVEDFPALLIRSQYGGGGGSPACAVVKRYDKHWKGFASGSLTAIFGKSLARAEWNRARKGWDEKALSHPNPRFSVIFFFLPCLGEGCAPPLKFGYIQASTNSWHVWDWTSV